MIFTDKDGNLTLAPQSATEEQQSTIEKLMKSNKYVDGTYGRFSDGRISVNVGGVDNITINQDGTIQE